MFSAKSQLKSKISLFILPFVLIMLIIGAGCSKEVKDPNTLLNTAVSLANEGNKWKESLEYAKEALNLDPNSSNAQVMYALALVGNDKGDQALKQLRTIVKDYPNNFLAQLSLGKILFDKKDYEGAYDNLTNAYKMQPDNIDVLILFSQCSAKLQAQNTDKLFLKLAKQKGFEDNPEIYNELGTYYANTRDISKAAQNLSKAYKLAPDNPVIVSNLGVFCDRFLNKPKKAKFFYRKFLILTTDEAGYSQLREEIINRLQSFSKT